MEFKYFELENGEEYNYKNQVIKKYQNQLWQLDDLLKQLFHQSKILDFRWTLYCSEGGFLLGDSRHHFVGITTSQFEKILNLHYLKTILNIWSKLPDQFVNFDDLSWPGLVYYDLDYDWIDINYNMKFFDHFHVRFIGYDIKQIPNLVQTSIKLKNLFDIPKGEKLWSIPSLNLALLKLIINQDGLNQTHIEQTLLKYCQTELNKSDCDLLDFKKQLDQTIKKQISDNYGIDLTIQFRFNANLNQIGIEFLGSFLGSTAWHQQNIFKQNLNLNFDQIKKLLNNKEFDQIVDEHKKDLQWSKINEAIFYNKF